MFDNSTTAVSRSKMKRLKFWKKIVKREWKKEWRRSFLNFAETEVFPICLVNLQLCQQNKTKTQAEEAQTTN